MTKVAIQSGAVPLWAVIAVLVICFSSLPQGQAVNPPPSGGYPGANTAEGQSALLSLTSGTFNTAVGFSSLAKESAGQFNTGVGAAALSSNMGDSGSGHGVGNTAIGAGALFSNTTGFNNTANGAFALFHNINASSNTAIGNSALFANIRGMGNTAVGFNALLNNDMTGNADGAMNTAVGNGALFANIDGNSNTAVGASALSSNTFGLFNVALGADALDVNTDGTGNIAIGVSALFTNVHGSFNTVIGDSAGAFVEGNDNIYIGTTAADGVTNESATIRIGNPQFVSNCFIAGIFGPSSGPGTPVVIDANGKLGISTSSSRFKDNIKPMASASESIFSLRPVTFRYKKELDPEGVPQFGLVAEDVEKVNPDLVVRTSEGKVYTVRYEAINAMLLNEFLKEHRKVEKLEKQVEALTVGLQKVSVQLEVNTPPQQTALNN